MTPDNITEFYSRLAQANPNPKSELDYVNPYTLLVAVVLSAQATDIGVNKATKALFEKVKTPQDMVELGEDALIAHIRTIGLYKTKAKNLQLLSRLLIHNHQGQVPDDRKSLEALPGVGHKTASVVLNVAFGHPTIAVDTHCFRVSNRTGLACGKTPEQVEAQLVAVTPPPFAHNAHHWLILHGRYVCKARKPDCSACPVSDLCEYHHKSLVSPSK
jgi:endonuclease III